MWPFRAKRRRVVTEQCPVCAGDGRSRGRLYCWREKHPAITPAHAAREASEGRCPRCLGSGGIDVWYVRDKEVDR